MNNNKTSDEKSNKIDQILMIVVVLISIAIVAISNPSVVKSMTSESLGAIIGSGLVFALIGGVVYNVSRGKLSNNFDDNKSSFIRGFFVSILVLILLSFTGIQKMEEQYAQDVIDDIKNVYNEGGDDQVKSEIGVIFKKYMNLYTVLESDFSKSLEESFSYTFEDVESLEDFKDLRLMEAMRESYVDTSEVYSDFFKEYNLISKQYKTEINGLKDNNNQAFLESFKEGFNESYDESQDQFIEFEEIADEYFDAQIKFLDVVIKNNDLFVVENGEVLFEDETALNEYNTEFMKAIETESEFVEFSEAFLESIEESEEEFNKLLK